MWFNSINKHSIFFYSIHWSGCRPSTCPRCISIHYVLISIHKSIFQWTSSISDGISYCRCKHWYFSLKPITLCKLLHSVNRCINSLWIERIHDCASETFLWISTKHVWKEATNTAEQWLCDTADHSTGFTEKSSAHIAESVK